MTEWHLTHNSRLVNLTLLCPEHHLQLHHMGGTLTPDPARTHGWQITHTTTGGVDRVISTWQKLANANKRGVLVLSFSASCLAWDELARFLV